jgi:chaperonin GroES
MKLKLQGQTVMIKPHENDEKSKGGIIIPKSNKNYQLSGDVVGVAVEASKHLKKGEKVFYNKRTATEIEDEGKVFHLVQIDNIFCTYD